MARMLALTLKNEKNFFLTIFKCKTKWTFVIDKNDKKQFVYFFVTENVSENPF